MMYQTFQAQTSGQSSGIKVLRLSELPEFLPAHNGLSLSQQVAQHLQGIINALRSNTLFQGTLMFPSLEGLEEWLDVPQQDIHRALRELKQQGYDNFIPGLYGPISFWEK